MSDLRDRLDRLPIPDDRPDPFGRGARDELRARLERLFGAGPEQPAGPEGRPVPIADCLPLEERTVGSRRVMLLDRPDARPLWGGRDPLEPPAPATGPELAYLAEELARRAPALEQVLFLDTETTGLAGGTGTYVFLVGVGRFVGGRFELRQLFMPDLEEEPALLEELAGWLDRAALVVTYNGKSYDLPLLETRYTLNRMPTPFERLIHVDLVHASRRFWSDTLANCRLETIERALLGFERTDDVPGREIPRRYHQYLADGDGRQLVGVFRHNAWDLLSLAGLYGRMLLLLGGPAEQLDARLLAVRGLIAQQLGLRREAIAAFEEALSARLEDPLSGRARRELSLLLKREERWEEAAAVWYEMLTADHGSLFPYVELAKFYEHRAGDLERAAALSRRALEVATGKRDRQRLVHRLNRLARRLERQR